MLQDPRRARAAVLNLMAATVWALAGGPPPPSFEIDSSRCVLQDPHLWVFDRTITVRPGLGDVGGLQGFFGPPIAGGKTTVAFTIDGRSAPAESTVWRPGSR